MEADKYLCPGCGMQIPSTSIDFKTRKAFCEFCGQHVIFPKRTSTASPSAIIALNQARDFFLNGDIKSAVNCAQTAVEMVPNHAAALFIIGYYKAFTADVKNRNSLDNLFNQILPDAEFEVEEEELFKTLMLKTILHTITYEEQILAKFAEYDDAKEIIDFVEQFCPFAIAKRGNMNWLTPRLVEVYKEISSKSSIPKTWYALYLSLTKNPDSPFVSNTFYLETKTQRYYDNYLLPIGEIFNSIGDQAVKGKFVGVYNKVKEQCEQKMSK